MFLFTYTAAVLAIVFVGTAAFLYVRGKKNTLTQLFIGYILSSAVWIGGNAVADISRNDEMLILASGIALAGSCCIVTFFLLFVDTFVDGRLPPLSRRLLYAFPTVCLVIFSFSDNAILGTHYPQHAPAQIIPGIHYYFFLIFLFGGLSYVLHKLIRSFLRSTGVRRLQTLYIGIGFLALFIGGVTFDIILPLMGELRFYNLGPQFSLILVWATSYAIFRHKLFDIRFAVQRGIIYSLLFFFIVSFYLSIITLSGFLLQQITPTAILVNAGITTILGIFTVPHIDRFLRRKTDAFFFKDSYDYADALYELSERIHKSVLLDDIRTLTKQALQRILKIENVLVSFTAKDEDPQHIGEATALSIPILFDEEMIGSIKLGEKRSGDPYTEEDIVLIKTFARQVAGAFQKAKLYEEVQDYSRELEARVAQRTQQIRELQETQKQMMLDISHKLQNPLTIVKSQLALFQKSDERESFKIFEHTIDEISAFMYDLLHLAQLETVPSGSIKKQDISLSEHIDELAEYFEVMAQEKNISLVRDIEEGITYACNRSQITELLTNLVSNAVKYADQKKSERTIKISLLRKASDIIICVSDNGLGIPEKDLPHMFTRFYRTELTRGIKGTGLGLAICKTIVEIHDGKIRVESVAGKGTTFTILLPFTSS